MAEEIKIDGKPSALGTENTLRKRQKVYIIYVSAGSGHKAASNALKATWEELYPEDEVVVRDILSFTTALFRFIYSRGYLIMASKIPILWRIAFDKGEDLHKFRAPGRVAWLFRKMIMGRYIRAMKREKPDIIISTHFMPSDGTYLLKKKGAFDFVFSIVITDYGIHSAWLTPGADRFYVPTENIKSELLTKKEYLGIGPDGIQVTGIPIHPKYTRIGRKEDLRRKYNLDPSIFTILLFRSVFTKENFEYFVNYICMIPHPMQLIMLAGKEWPIADRIKRKFVEHNITYRIFGYIDFMEELMALSDLVITKSGGLTTSECLASGAPIAIYKPYAGQEERNAEYLMEEGAGLKINQLAGLPYRLSELIENEQKLKSLRLSARRIAKPDAAYKIIRDLKKLGEKVGHQN